MIYIVLITTHNIDYDINVDFLCNMNIKILLQKIKKMIGRISSFYIKLARKPIVFRQWDEWR